MLYILTWQIGNAVKAATEATEAQQGYPDDPLMVSDDDLVADEISSASVSAFAFRFRWHEVRSCANEALTFWVLAAMSFALQASDDMEFPKVGCSTLLLSIDIPVYLNEFRCLTLQHHMCMFRGLCHHHKQQRCSMELWSRSLLFSFYCTFIYSLSASACFDAKGLCFTCIAMGCV